MEMIIKFIHRLLSHTLGQQPNKIYRKYRSVDKRNGLVIVVRNCVLD